MSRIILIGFMGCGKSTLGKKLANRLDVPFIDSDKEIEKSHHKTVGEIFGEYGESGFREMESDFVDSLKEKESFVLATGGGMPCFNYVIGRLNEIGETFYLERSAKELTHRLANAKTKRPLLDSLSEDDLLTFIEERLEERKEHYKKADVILSRDEQNVNEMIRLIELLHV
ncbi:MAG TPA: shikimate kinase [Crocinitomicaceae bacterium]|nr:shikimate kinase [Crocinitomicaceae bacterium]